MHSSIFTTEKSEDCFSSFPWTFDKAKVCANNHKNTEPVHLMTQSADHNRWFNFFLKKAPITYSICTGLPAGRTNFSVLVSVLEGLNETYGLVHWPTDGQVIHCNLSQNALAINDEQTAQGVTLLLQQHTIVLADLMCQVWEERDFNLSKTALSTGCFRPTTSSQWKETCSTHNLHPLAH